MGRSGGRKIFVICIHVWMFGFVLDLNVWIRHKILSKLNTYKWGINEILPEAKC